MLSSTYCLISYILILNNYVFHGRTIVATPSNYVIRTLSSSHVLDPLECDNCKNYTAWLQRSEINIMKRAIRQTIKDVYEQQLATAKTNKVQDKNVQDIEPTISNVAISTSAYDYDEIISTTITTNIKTSN